MSDTVTTEGVYDRMAPATLGVSVTVAASPLTSSVGAVWSSTLIGNCAGVSLPAKSVAVQLAVHDPSGMKVDVPSTGRGTLVAPCVRTQLTLALPLLSVAVTETLTLAPPAVLPSTCASTPTPLRFSGGGVVSITPSPESLVPFTGLVSGCERTMVPVWLARFWNCVSVSSPNSRSVEKTTCFGPTQNVGWLRSGFTVFGPWLPASTDARSCGLMMVFMMIWLSNTVARWPLQLMIAV